MNEDGPTTEPGGRPVCVRVRLDLSYDGAGFAGWAAQPGQRTVLGVVADALAVLAPSCGPVTVAGRTDAGVHATGQVAHVDVCTEEWIHVGDLRARLAGVLPLDVRVRDVREVPTAFDARFAALWRRYVYRISDAPWGVEPLRRTDTLHWRRSLDAAAMQRAGTALLGTHDFAAYCRRRDNATTIRELQHLTIQRDGQLLEVDVQADAFCHSMVRSLVGALLAVGDGRQPPEWPASLLTQSSRAGDVQVAPAHGLTLAEVGYPPEDQLASRIGTTRAVRDLRGAAERPGQRA
ncbi:MAG: tRNA pseudouridine(38-40) synthase TruA [Actinomycetota bacterium]|nr:tRNA pseudouridine(38-40) synthase TruA [Actinomycetota bacterium]